MKEILLDTNAYAAFKRGDAEAVQVLQHASRIYLNTVILGELLAGFISGQWEARSRRELNAFLESSRVAILGLEEATAEFYARVYAGLRRKGRPIPTNDLWIAATALQHGIAVFTYDEHFLAVDGLIIGTRFVDFVP